MRRFAFLLLACAAAAAAQDEQRVLSPDGAIEFRLFVDQPQPGGLSRLAYEVLYHKKYFINTSYLGLDIYNQEPLLGENAGLMSVSSGSHSLVAQYMQNGSLGRRINVEVRVFNDGVAFRYIIPPSTPLDDLLIADEVTEFDLAGGVPPQAPLTLPYVAGQPGAGWLSISESPPGSYPPMRLMHFEDSILITRLRRTAGNPMLSYEGKPPLTCPWRIIAIGPTRESVLRNTIAAELER